MKNYVLFKHPYVLIEDSKGKYRPIYKEYPKNMPTLNLNSPALCCPFSNAVRNRTQSKKAAGPKQGYCEICYTKYNDYVEHVKAREHIEYAEDPNNYKTIDSFITEFNRNNSAYNAVLRSPCDKLEAELAQSNALFYTSAFGSGSCMRMSMDSTEVVNDAIQYDVLTAKDVDNNFSKEK